MPAMPTLDVMERCLGARRGGPAAAALITRVQGLYDSLYARRPFLRNQQLARNVEGHLLPKLALYKALLAEGEGREEALALVQDIAAEMMLEQPASRDGVAAAKGALPFARFRRSIHRDLRSIFDAEGFIVEWVEDSPQRVAFNITRCHMLEALAGFGASELAPVFCRLDDIMGRSLAPAIVWRRTSSLGEGGDKCDFCYEPGRKEPQGLTSPTTPATKAARKRPR